MKFIVFSDSHGVADNMIRAVRIEKPDLCFFLGDGERDLNTLQKRFPHLPVNAVRGNCDVFSSLPQTLVCAAGGLKFFITHGHLYGVKHDPIFRELCEAALDADADVVYEVSFSGEFIPSGTERWGDNVYGLWVENLKTE